MFHDFLNQVCSSLLCKIFDFEWRIFCRIMTEPIIVSISLKVVEARSDQFESSFEHCERGATAEIFSTFFLGDACQGFLIEIF